MAQICLAIASLAAADLAAASPRNAARSKALRPNPGIHESLALT